SARSTPRVRPAWARSTRRAALPRPLLPRPRRGTVPPRRPASHVGRRTPPPTAAWSRPRGWGRNAAQRFLDRADAAEGATQQQRFGELDLELVLESEYHVHRGMRGQAGPVQVGLVAQLLDRLRELGVLPEDGTDAVTHGRGRRASRW